MLKTRAALLANEKGLKVNGVESAPPSKYFMKKIMKAKRLDKAYNNEKWKTTASHRDGIESSELQDSLKFTMRETKRNHMQRDAIGSLDAASLNGMQ